MTKPATEKLKSEFIGKGSPDADLSADELRAIGDIQRDQLFYLKRVGFNAFAIRADKDIDAALKSFNDFSDVYQGSVVQTSPLFRRRQITASAS